MSAAAHLDNHRGRTPIQPPLTRPLGTFSPRLGGRKKGGILFGGVIRFLVIGFYCCSVSAESLENKLNSLIESTLPTARVSVLIKDADSDKILYQREAEKLAYPASSTKLFTAAAALYQLGPDFFFSTSLLKSNSHYYIRFTGDPSFTTNDLDTLLNAFNTKGIKTITGHLVLDVSRYNPPFYSGGVSYDDLGYYYTAPSTALILNENATDYQFTPAKALKGKVQITPKTNEKPLTIVNELITVSKEEAKEHCTMNVQLGMNNTMRVYGCLPQTKNPKIIRLAIPDPITFGKNVIKNKLTTHGVTLKGRIIQGKAPSQAQLIETKSSATLLPLLTHMLQDSDNLYADAFTKTLGYTITGEGSYKQGVFAIKHILEKNTPINTSQLKLADGMGSRYDLATCEAFVSLLSTLYHDNALRPLILSALPHMGISGTLKGRMKNTPLENNVIAKTGTMQDISSLSGYLVKSDKHVIIFSIITNGIQKVAEAKALENKILLMLFNMDLQ